MVSCRCAGGVTNATRLYLALIPASLGLVLSCAGSPPNIPVESLDASHQFAYVSDHKTIAIMNGDGSGVEELSEQSGEIVSPSWSPDGTRIAFFRIETSNILGLGHDITLCCYDLITGQTDQLAEAEPEVVFRAGTPKKSLALSPPVWQSNRRPSVNIMPSEGKAIRKLASGDTYGYPIWRRSSEPYSESDTP